MEGVSTNPRVPLCTSYRRFKGDYLDVAGMSVCKFPRARAPLRISPGLRLIKQNVPEVEILELPRRCGLKDVFLIKLGPEKE